MPDAIRNTRNFLLDVQEQINKVTWPDWPQLKNSTFVIIVFVVILALIIFAMDFLAASFLTVLRGLFGG